MAAQFIKTTEDFICLNCKFKVKGTGYTNHCPRCLFSKHVDVSPGDRTEKCGGMMVPVNLEIEKGNYILTHKCEKCGIKRRCKTAKDDDVNALLKLSETLVKNKFF